MTIHSDATMTAGALRESIPFPRLPWIRPIVDAYFNRFDEIASAFAGNPADPGAWRAAIARATTAPRDRAAIARITTAQIVRRGGADAARQAAASLANPQTVAIVTGQQAGAFGGPLYTLLKAVTALQTTRRIREEFGVPAVAVFWVADEDHDWQEIKAAEILDKDFGVATVALPELAGASAQPVGALRLDERIGGVLDTLGATLPPTEFSARLMDQLSRRYAPGMGVGEAFAGWIEDLLGGEGLIVFEGGDPAAKPLASAIFAREFDAPGHTAVLARRAGQALAQLGHAPQVEPAEDATGLFYLDEAGRIPIRSRDGAFVIGAGTRDAASLRAEALAHPERFSPNVLLRAVVQDQLFPTICYVPGPSELAYHAQLGEIYAACRVSRPLLYPRASVTIVDGAAARFLERYLPLEALQPQDESALNRLLESQLPDGIERGLDELVRTIGNQVGPLKPAIEGVDPTLGGLVDSTIERVQDAVKSLQGKIVQASKRKHDTLRRQFVRTRALTFPGGHAQERSLSVAFFANRYGPAFVEQLLTHVPASTGRHYVICL